MTEKDIINEQDSDADVINTIMLLRIYDMLLIIARGVNMDEAVEAVKMHAQGKILSPPPMFDMSEDEQS